MVSACLSFSLSGWFSFSSPYSSVIYLSRGVKLVEMPEFTG